MRSERSKRSPRGYTPTASPIDYARRAAAGRRRESDHSDDGDVDRRVAHRTPEDQEARLKERSLQHRGNAEVVCHDLLREQSIDVSLFTVERAVLPFRRLLTAEAKATVRFETDGYSGRGGRRSTLSGKSRFAAAGRQRRLLAQ